MSNEISITVTGVLSNTSGAGSSPLKRTYTHGTAQMDQATKKRSGESQGLSSSWEAIDLGDLTSGYVFLLNIDATFNVDFGPQDPGSGGDGILLATMRPGDPPALIQLAAGVTIMARASGGSGATATVDVEVWSL